MYAGIATTRIAPCIQGLWLSDQEVYSQVMRASAMHFVFKGVQLVAFYLILVAMFYLIPAEIGPIPGSSP